MHVPCCSCTCPPTRCRCRCHQLLTVISLHICRVCPSSLLLLFSCSNSPKSLAKLRRQVRRTKEVLSANSAAPITVEELHAGQDFQSSIKRAEFEDLAGDFWDRAAVSSSKQPWCHCARSS